MKRSPILISLSVAAVLALAGGAWWLWSVRADTQPALRTQIVSLGSVEDTVTAVGTLQPLNYVDVGTQVSGQLRQIFVDFGEKVEQGQLLAQIDPTVYEARVAADQANLLALRAQRSDKLVQLGLAEKQFERQRRLLADRATSQDAYDSAEAARRSLQAQIAVLDAQIQQGEATLKSDQANLSYTKIYAPMTGTVVDITARQGQTLNANQQAPIILRIANLATMTVRTQVSEADVPKLKLGMEAYFTTLGRPDRKWSGQLRQILPTPEVVNNVVLYPALFDVANESGDLLPQMSAQVFFIIARADNLPVVPMSALRPLPEGRNRYALRVMENGQPVRRVVEVAASNRVTAAVASGLKEGEEVLLDLPPQGNRAASAGAAPRMPRL
ncbi:MAG TPA: efflux RND transporter periplasmic adaptor subunit [Ferrovibrio sp.]|uniref:efflux RND transporter periplasmic adaptor subunit n=1 Tax=Ferrovibrio sp. TaxID=1917215 RepID=UPI002B4B121C|nr:efflux RND transporter periplasmic adaptor subunit [Ferrovibrio sp.]HLT76300.1 efflux RND transporter periplasmic adaptor subunit [Ferrovibrio sp.]